MPSVKPNESKKEYMARCIPMLMDEGKTQAQSIAVCNSMFEQHSKQKESRTRMGRDTETERILSV